MTREHNTEKTAGVAGGAQAGGGPAGEAGLDLSLGHFGTPEENSPRGRYLAWCLACDTCLSDTMYVDLVAMLGADPPCPGCGRSAWDFDPVTE